MALPKLSPGSRATSLYSTSMASYLIKHTVSSAPAFSTATYVAHTHHPESEPLPSPPPRGKPIPESFHSFVEPQLSLSPAALSQFDKPRKRRAFFSNPTESSVLQITPSDVLSIELCYGRISYPDVRLRLPFGISFDLLHFIRWQPMRIMAVRRYSQGGRPRDEDILFCGELRFINVDDENGADTDIGA